MTPLSIPDVWQARWLTSMLAHSADNIQWMLLASDDHNYSHDEYTRLDGLGVPMQTQVGKRGDVYILIPTWAAVALLGSRAPGALIARLKADPDLQAVLLSAFRLTGNLEEALAAIC